MDTNEKKELRRAIRAQIEALAPAEKAASDAAMLARFLESPEFARAETILLFYGVGIEPETAQLFAPLWQQGKRLLLPATLPERQMEARLVIGLPQLEPDHMGIPTPLERCPTVPREDIDLILVPAMCYDRQGYRLGQGGGYYDRYLADYKGVTLGLCRDALLQDKLPTQPHDLPVQVLLTETQRLVP